MKFWAKVEVKGEENASELVLAFFREFNLESSITIQGKEAKVEIIFDNNPPMEIIKAVHQCRVKEFYYGKVLGEYMEGETQQVSVEEETPQQTEEMPVEEETPQQTEEMPVEEETPQQIEKTRKKRGRSTDKKGATTKVVSTETVDVPRLEEIAKKATSFEHFVKLVAEWLEMGKKQQFFENLVMVASEVEKVVWKELENALREKGITCNQWDKIWTGQRVSEKLRDYSVTMLPFLNAMRQYKGYHFAQENCEEKASTGQATEETVTTVEEEILTRVEEVKPKIRVKMECMPEIIYFEEVLEKVDKTQSIEERVKYVLNSMGLEKRSAQEQHGILEIVNVAVTLEKPDWDTIFSKSSQPTEYLMNARMNFSKFINDFVSEYNRNTMVKSLTFLKQLQKIVMNESEIKSFTDATN